MIHRPCSSSGHSPHTNKQRQSSLESSKIVEITPFSLPSSQSVPQSPVVFSLFPNSMQHACTLLPSWLREESSLLVPLQEVPPFSSNLQKKKLPFFSQECPLLLLVVFCAFVVLKIGFLALFRAGWSPTCEWPLGCLYLVHRGGVGNHP